MNLYAYVYNDPLNRTDPTGNSPIDLEDCPGRGCPIDQIGQVGQVAFSDAAANDQTPKQAAGNRGDTMKDANDKLGVTVSATEAATKALEMKNLAKDVVAVGNGVTKPLAPVNTLIVGGTAALQAASGDTEGAKLTLLTEANNTAGLLSACVRRTWRRAPARS